MKNKIQMLKLSHEEGFTLTELIVVIVIIGILAAIAIPMYINNRNQATDVALKADVKHAADLLEASMTEGEIRPTVPSSFALSNAGSMITPILPP